MINAIGAMHAAMRHKPKRHEDRVGVRVETKKRLRPRQEDQDEDDHPPPPRRSERGRSA